MLLWWPPCPSWCPSSLRTRPYSLTVTSLSFSSSSSSMEYRQWVELWWRETCTDVWHCLKGYFTQITLFFSHSDLRNVHVPSLSAILCSPLLLSFSLASQIFFSFMLTPLFKKPKFASTVGSMLTVVFGCLSLFTVLMKDFPQPLVWLLCLLSPSAFSIGIAQVTNTQTCLNSHILLDWSCFVMKYLISPWISLVLACWYFFPSHEKVWRLIIMLVVNWSLCVCVCVLSCIHVIGGLPGGSGRWCSLFLTGQWPPSSLRTSAHVGSGLCSLPSFGYLLGPGTAW